MPTAAFDQLFGSMTMFYGFLLPVIIAQLIALVLLPTFLKGGRVRDGGRATFCVLAEGTGIILMALGGLPTLASVLAKLALPAMTYASLLFTFVIGGLVFLRHDHLLHDIDPASRAVPQAIAFYTWKTVGLLLSVLGFLYLLVYVLLTQGDTSGNWWAVPTTLFLFGVLLTWATSHDGVHPPFQQAPVQKKVAVKKAGKRK